MAPDRRLCLIPFAIPGMRIIASCIWQLSQAWHCATVLRLQLVRLDAVQVIIGSVRQQLLVGLGTANGYLKVISKPLCATNRYIIPGVMMMIIPGVMAPG
eukprot:GHRQ01010113.1.p2 GENE.GHRQ01010113.1~~GHRQ01010113.1.p2  ORF type:complete len:100 (+),score=13.80 GHRQ01010113.1:523-822(+)